MTHWLKGLLGILVLLAALGAGMFARHWLEGDAATPANDAQLGVPAPAFSMPDLDGRERRLDEWSGRVVVLNFWATWCAPCLEEIPMFIEAQRRHGDAGLQFVGVALDEPDAVRRFSERLGINYPLLVDAAAGLQVIGRYGNMMSVLPYTVLIDREGRIQEAQAAALDARTLERWLDTWLHREQEQNTPNLRASG